MGEQAGDGRLRVLEQGRPLWGGTWLGREGLGTVRDGSVRDGEGL